MTTDVVQALRNLGTLEDELGGLYADLVRRFDADAEASTLFSRLGRGKDSQRLRLDQENRIVRQNPKKFRDLVLDDVLLNQALERVREVRAAGLNGTPLEVSVAIQSLEDAVAEVYRRSSFNDCCDHCRSFVHSLLEASLKQQQFLTDFARKDLTVRS